MEIKLDQIVNRTDSKLFIKIPGSEILEIQTGSLKTELEVTKTIKKKVRTGTQGYFQIKNRTTLVWTSIMHCLYESWG